jgi:RNA polymerase sigma factor (sigma-70 family)
LKNQGMNILTTLLQRARSGDISAEDKIFRHLRVRFTLLAKRRIGGVDAEDIAHEACLTVLEKYKTLTGSVDFEAWAYTVLRNKIGNYLQSRSVRNRTMRSSGQTDTAPAGILSAPDPDLRRRLKRSLRLLVKTNPRYARVLNLAHQGYTTAEICERLKISPNHLYVLLNRSRKLLTQYLDVESD